MKYLLEFIGFIFMSVHFKLLKKIDIVKYDGRTMELNATWNGNRYKVKCQEVVYRHITNNNFAKAKKFRQYIVEMQENDDTTTTWGIYPQFCINKYAKTDYPYMLAIRYHYKINYA